MAVKLRLVRIGKKKQPTYRVVAADSRSPRNGRFIEIVGTYAPRGKSTAEPDAVIEIDSAKVDKWLSQGATPTDRVAKLIERSAAAPSAPSVPPATPATAAATAPAAAATEAAATESVATAEPAGENQ